MNKVKNICEILREEISIPVFEYTLPDGYTRKCIVVAELGHDFLVGEGEYHVNIYAPNVTRLVDDGIEDHSCPDRDTLDDLYQQVSQVLRGLWNSEYDINLVQSQLVRDGAMHYLNLFLTIQF